ncbi:pogo transposable element derived with ZNF domain b isoform X3 [Alosa sapidissima]|uniref:pogo transposable element derived with ZNF domain b isoform X3 n=1 Tax=Alosa sapidissima TaxID=34773 RepID=UPI001C098966|nr:pogo transposable element derived with ZNF domain b isoform X3 [Alosa sapidissima]
MSDSDLFMECEEEELEPWQQIHENIEAERIEPFESINTVKQVTGMPAVQPVVTPVPAPAPVASTHVVLSGQTLSGSSGSSGSSKDTALPLQSLLTSMGSIPVTLPAGLKPGPGQQLIFTQGAGGLSTVALSQMLLPGHGHGTSTSQPIFFTTQGLPVQNLTAGQNPLGIVLNVQQGQTIKPITLVSAPGTSIFKQAVGGTQIINQPTPLQTVTQVGTVNHPAAPTHTTTFTRVQIPATITIRNTTPISHPKPTMVTTSSSLPSVKTTTLPANMANTSGLLTVKPGEGSTDRPKLVSLVNQPQTLILLPSQKANGLPASSTATAQLNIQASSTATSPSGLKICPRCGAQFKMIEALRGHMCFCCPDLTQAPTTSKVSPLTQAPTTSKVSAVTQAPTTSKVSPPIAPVPVQKEAEKLVMLVDDFYYGTYEGNRTNAAQDNLTNPLVFKCLTCGKKLRSNIRLMNHMKHHVELEQQNGEMDTHTSCQHCYRQFPTPFRLQCHLESVHSSYESSTKCKICEWAFETEPVFLQHMKNTHKPGEMPYVCQVCQYRSSFYSDVYNHFRTWHEDTRYLLCLYCLKTFKNSNSYQQHFSRHQKSTVYHCNKCRLQFLFTKEKLDHKLCHHKTFRKPQQLEGVSAGTKVTIRAYAINKLRSTSSGPLPGAPPPTQPKPEPAPAPVRLPQPSVPPQPMQTIQIIQQPRASASKKPISKMIELLTKFQEQRPLHGKQKCIECNYEVPDFSHHFPTYVHCSLCSYSTCCSRAYANHMITNHVARRNPKHKGYTLPPPSLLRMVCSDCDLVTFNGDMMARHLVQNPDHSYSTCTPKVSPKVGFIESREGSDMRRNRVSGSVSESLGEDSVLERNPDEEMAPLEDSESDMDQMDDPMQMSAVEYEESSRNSGQDVSQEAHTQITPTHESPKLEPQCSSREQQEEVPSARQLKTLLLTLCSGINKASEIHATKPKLIEAWLREKKEQLEHKCQRDAIDGGEAGGPVDQLVEWVLAQQEQHLPVSGENLFQKASEFHSKANQKSTFRVSHEWAVRFMLQHSLGVQAIANVGRPLPSSMEGTSQHFTDFVHQQIKQNGLCHSVIGAMDELSIFVDVDCLLDSATLEKKPTFQFVGSGKSLIDVHLTILSDGTVLPALVFFNGQLPSRLFSELPNCVLVEGKVEGFTEEEELNIWIERVWRKHLSSRSESKALLVMDGHRRHTSVSSLDNLSNCNTVPAMIPTGCSARHQPLDMCFRPVLQMFLLGRWAQLAEKGGAAGVSASDVVQLLVDWLVEALTSISDRPEVIQRSFCLAKVVDRQGEGDNNPADVQAELITTVKEAMLQTAEIETKASAEEVPGDTATTEINREQVEEEGHESQLERLPGHETDSASANKDE